MALSANKPRQYDPAVDPCFIDLPAKTSATLYEGAAVTDESGGGTVDTLAVAEGFIGFLEAGLVATSTAGEVKARVRTKGIIKNLAVTGVTGVTDYGVAVYATDDDTFTLTASGALQIGKVVRYTGTTGYADVYFEGAAIRSI